MHICHLSSTAVESATKRSCVVHVMQVTKCLTKKRFVGGVLKNVITLRKNAGTRITWRTASNTLGVTTKQVVVCATNKLGIVSKYDIRELNCEEKGKGGGVIYNEQYYWGVIVII